MYLTSTRVISEMTHKKFIIIFATKEGFYWETGEARELVVENPFVYLDFFPPICMYYFLKNHLRLKNYFQI